MTPDEMQSLFQRHREAEARRDYDGVIATFSDDCFLQTMALGSHSRGRTECRAAYVAYFTAFPDLAPEDDGYAVGDNVAITWGHLAGTHMGPWLGVEPTGGSFRVPFTNVSHFTEDRMQGEQIYFDLATLCEQARIPLNAIRAAAAARIASSN